MTNLSRQVRRTAKSASSISGTIVDVSGDTGSVRLSTNGALMRNLKVMGGPVAIGQIVDVNFSTSLPVIVAYSSGGITSNDASKIVDTARTPWVMSEVPEETAGGHTIMNSTGTTYAQRTNLKIVGQPSGILAIADDSDGDATVITSYAVKIYHNTVFVAYAVSINFVDGT
jgi:hypothetical protein